MLVLKTEVGPNVARLRLPEESQLRVFVWYLLLGSLVGLKGNQRENHHLGGSPKNWLVSPPWSISVVATR